MIDTADQHEIDQVFHISDVFAPTVSPENFAKTVAVLSFVERGGGSGKRSERMTEKVGRRIISAYRRDVNVLRRIRLNLMKHHVHSRHILPGLALEVMSRSSAGHKVAVHILDDMPDVARAAVATPLTHALGKAVAVKIGNYIHIRDTYFAVAVVSQLPQRDIIGLVEARDTRPKPLVHFFRVRKSVTVRA